MWYSSCRPCRVEFNALKELKESLKNEDFEFLNLARETSHPNSFQLWKNAVKKLDLRGWHVYMSPELEASLVNAIKDNTEEGLKGYPHFLLVNKDGEIVSYNAPLPSQKEQFLSEINKVSN